MLQQTAHKTAGSHRDKLLWVALGALAAAQVIAFWMLCNDQVAKAQERHASIQTERYALANCLQSVSRSTVPACGSQGGGVARADVVVNNMAVGGNAKLVSFTR